MCLYFTRKYWKGNFADWPKTKYKNDITPSRLNGAFPSNTKQITQIQFFLLVILQFVLSMNIRPQARFTLFDYCFTSYLAIST
jgi:hypothetical protein